MADAVWLAATWPFVREHLPPPPARILELGCGPLGGFVPRMRELGYDAIGVDPEAPDGSAYDRAEFEHHETSGLLDAVVACTSLHHVTDLDAVLDRIDSVLTPSGTIVVVEWASERFDEAAARWCFDRLTADEDGWLQHHRNHWQQSGQSWDHYMHAWLTAERLHAGHDILRGLQTRFDTAVAGDGPYFFADLDGTTITEEQAAIDAGLFQANGLYFVGHPRVRVAN